MNDTPATLIKYAAAILVSAWWFVQTGWHLIAW